MSARALAEEWHRAVALVYQRNRDVERLEVDLMNQKKWRDEAHAAERDLAAKVRDALNEESR